MKICFDFFMLKTAQILYLTNNQDRMLFINCKKILPQLIATNKYLLTIYLYLCS